jgi:hypothetical protein
MTPKEFLDELRVLHEGIELLTELYIFYVENPPTGEKGLACLSKKIELIKFDIETYRLYHYRLVRWFLSLRNERPPTI